MSRRRVKPAPPAPKPRTRDAIVPDLAICAALLIAVFAVYAQVGHFEFVNYDDPEYVTANPEVQAGLTAAGFKWAWTAVVAGNWMPVTLLSHAAAVQLFGMNSGAHHLLNVLLHGLAAVILFAAFLRATRARWPSAFMAAMFALHPAHVESVAWIAERKDVLSALFGFLGLYAYVRYSERPDVPRYLLVVVAFVLSLMSKPMLVTFPFILLLLDIWPLRRLPANGAIRRLKLEKAPFFVLSAAACIATWLAQGSSGAMQTIPLLYRLRSALVACAVYIGQTFWPADLAVFYPYRNPPLWQVTLAALVLAGITALALRWSRVRPYIAIGWFWFLGTLVPVIGIVQVGSQAHADRYTYIPMVGLSIILAWGAAALVTQIPSLRIPVTALAAVALAAWLGITARQVSYWRNSETLFQHAIAVTRDNYEAERGLAMYLAQTGRASESVPHFQEVLRLIPDDARVHNNLGIIFNSLPGRQADAISHFEAAVRYRPDFMEAHYNLGLVLSQIPGRTAEAIGHLETANRLQPNPAIPPMIERLRDQGRNFTR